MKHAVRMSLHAPMDVAYKDVGYVTEMMTVVIILMNRNVHQQHVFPKKNLPALIIHVLQLNGVVIVNQTVQMVPMKE